MQFIAQNPSPTPTAPAPPSVADWGIAGAIIFLIVKEGLAWFKQKDQGESALTASLVEDLRMRERELREHLQKQERTAEGLRLELQAMEGRLARRQTEIIVDIREKLAQQEQILKGLHARLDKAHIHPASDETDLRVG